MNSTFEVWTVRKLIDLTIANKLNPNPIGQRPPVMAGHGKSINIVISSVLGYGVGMITVRDIRFDKEMQEIYPGYEYLVIDGGHRVRALTNYYLGKFRIHGKLYNESGYDFNKIQIPMDIKVCTSQEAIAIFRNVNETTNVLPIEMIMCDDQSVICREVRTRTQYYNEYENVPLKIFDRTWNQKQEAVSTYFSTTPNPRREWDKYVFVAIHKTIGKGNVDAGETDSEDLIKDEYNGINKVSKTVLKNVDRFFEDLWLFQKNRTNTVKLNGEIFSAFQLVWFSLYEQNQDFKIANMEQFKNRFMEAYGRLTGKTDTTYNTKMIIIENGKHAESFNIKEYFRRGMKNFSNGVLQRKCAELIMDEMDGDIGVIFRDAKRSISTSERELMLAKQGYKCAIDGEPLKLEDSVWGHDTPWAKGGSLIDGAVIHKDHNRDMGSTTLEEYRIILKMRKEKAA
jgi:hypothetical protein